MEKEERKKAFGKVIGIICLTLGSPILVLVMLKGTYSLIAVSFLNIFMGFLLIRGSRKGHS
jgi:hypothetical protein